jgi:hypothetical protein
MNDLNKPRIHFEMAYLNETYALIGNFFVGIRITGSSLCVWKSIGLVNNHSKLYTAVVCPKSGQGFRGAGRATINCNNNKENN